MSDMWVKSPSPQCLVVHPVTPIGSPYEYFLNAVCKLRHGYFRLADHREIDDDKRV